MLGISYNLCGGSCTRAKEVVLSGGAPTPAGTSMFIVKNLHKHNGDMGMGHLYMA